MGSGITTSRASALLAAIAGLGLALPTFAQVDPASGIDFVTVGAVGNAAYPGDGTPGDRSAGRGGVDYEYRIGRYEVTTSQWTEFFNAAFDRPANDLIPHLLPPVTWGAVPTTPTTPGGRRWTVPASNEMRAVGNISWRMAAIYCNWLHNGKATNREAFLSGAYDVSTFGASGPLGDIFTDQFARSPGAQYFIPTWDEWLKAAHYDPNKANGDGTIGGWWQYSNGSDTPYVYGPPGVLVNGQLATANAGWWIEYPSVDPFHVNLGAYAGVQSPWGLIDVAGATSEWTESVLETTGGRRFRYFDGSSWIFGPTTADMPFGYGNELPNVPTYEFGLRVAAVVPGPASLTTAAAVTLLVGRRRRGGSSWLGAIVGSHQQR